MRSRTSAPASLRLDRAFAALSDPTRRALMARLTAGPTSVQDLARPFRMSQPAISKHLRVLEEAGLIRQDRQGKLRPRRLDLAGLAQVDAWLQPYRAYLLKPELLEGSSHGRP